MKVYIMGPINGFPDGNAPAFAAAADQLREMGHEPVNPHDIGPLEHEGPCLGSPTINPTAHRYGCYMVPDIHALLDCDGYTKLPGWSISKGATVENAVAIVCGKKLVVLSE